MDQKTQLIDADKDTDPCELAPEPLALPKVSSMMLADAAAEFRKIGDDTGNYDARQLAAWLEELVESRGFITMLRDKILRVRQAR